jgi:Fic family protein
MKRDLHPVSRAALFHLRFEGVHPFIDGNGRTGRLVMNLELMKDGFPPINIKYADRRRYYDCFHFYHTRVGNPEDMEALVAEYVEAALDAYLKIIHQKERARRQSPER